LKITNFLFTAAILSLAGMSAYADTLNGATLQSWSPTVLNSPGTGPYWNNLSGEGPLHNIGSCLTGTGNCQIANPPGALSYYGNGTAAPFNMSFTSSGTAQEVSLLGVFTTQTGVTPLGTDYFGWYTYNNGVVTMNPLLNSTEAIGSYSTFLPTGNYGFYLENVQSPGTSYTANYFWFTDSGLDYTSGPGAPPTDGLQHFSIFGGTNGTFYLGLEDTPAPSGDFDYNDMVIELQPVPEPSSFALMAGGVGLLSLLFRVVFRSNSQNGEDGNNRAYQQK